MSADRGGSVQLPTNAAERPLLRQVLGVYPSPADINWYPRPWHHIRDQWGQIIILAANSMEVCHMEPDAIQAAELICTRVNTDG